MTLFSWLLVGHLVGDFLVQTRWMAEKKTTNWFPLLIHSILYTLTVALFALISGGLSYTALIFVVVTHVMLDRRGFVDFWAEKITKSAGIPWLTTMIDQSWHILVLALSTMV